MRCGSSTRANSTTPFSVFDSRHSCTSVGRSTFRLRSSARQCLRRRSAVVVPNNTPAKMSLLLLTGFFCLILLKNDQRGVSLRKQTRFCAGEYIYITEVVRAWKPFCPLPSCARDAAVAVFTKLHVHGMCQSASTQTALKKIKAEFTRASKMKSL